MWNTLYHIMINTNKRNKIDIEEKIEESNTNNLPVEVKKEKFFEKIVNFFKKLFHL